MIRRHLRRNVCVCIHTSVVLCCGLAAMASGDEPGTAVVPAPRAVDAAGPHKYVEVGRCAGCHKIPNRDAYGKSMEYYQFDEWKIYNELDKHSMAFNVLDKSNSTSAQISRLLDINPPTDARCLSCHSLAVDAKQYAPEVAAGLQQGGVSCQACHGPALDWNDKHSHIDQWRQDTNKDEEKKFSKRKNRSALGMTNLRDPVVRADTCLSCHLGNVQEGKVVTHEMYAAGHPPVSGFEIETFLAAMPRHWDPTKSLPPDYENEYGGKPEKQYASRMVAVAGLVALRNYARLLRDEAQQRKAASAAGSVELAFYDCQACHHELSVPSWRQRRGYGGQPPGRPRIRAWPLALARLRAAGNGDEALVKDLDALYGALGSKPFGDPDKAASAAALLVDKADAAANALKGKPFDDKAASALFARLCQVGLEEVPDFESARQIGWALCVVYKDLQPPAGKEAEAKKHLTALVEELALGWPKKTEQLPSGRPPKKELAFETSIKQAFHAAAKYDPVVFQEHCKQLAQFLK